MFRIIFITAFVFLLLNTLLAQPTQTPYILPAEHHVPGRPWTTIIPDPDKFDWTTTGARPGYQYRGMQPAQQRFYDYIQRKRRDSQPLSWAEQATIRRLIASRRWPEAPRPNQFWAAYMRYLRTLPSLELNVAQNLMFSELQARGLVGVDQVPTVNTERIRNYLNSGPFQSRNWFERTFGRVEPWMDNLYAGWGYDLREPAGPSGNAFPATGTFNGLRTTYNVSGATLGAPVDKEGFTITRHYNGVLGTGKLTVSGTVHIGSGFGADADLSVWAGDQKQEKKFYMDTKSNPNGPTVSYELSVPIPADARTGGFALRLDGRYSMGGGHRGCYVTGTFGPSMEQIAADQAEADAKWRRQVEDTLQRLGYENTPEGKEIEAMRQALAGGNSAWKAFVDSRVKALAAQSSPEIEEYKAINRAMEVGGDAWENYVKTHSGVATGDAPGSTPAGGIAVPTPKNNQSPGDVGGLQVGTSAVNGQITDSGSSFEAPKQVTCALTFKNLPANSTALAIWVRNGQEVIRSTRSVSGNGWVSFSLLGGGNQALTPGTYTVTITVGDKVLGRKTFTITGGAMG